MNIVTIHNLYNLPGGEDAVYRSESEMLRRHGHYVIQYTKKNKDINIFKLPSGLLWSARTYKDLSCYATSGKVDIAHFHNIFYSISPSGYYAFKKHKIPVVQTLHNYRILCPNALFYRDGEVCEKCLGRVPWPAVVHGCFKSRPASFSLSFALVTHRTLGTWSNAVDMYIALTDFARSKFIEGGIPPEKISVKPNFVLTDPGVGEGRLNFALFVGRLSPEKGVQTLLDAWTMVRNGTRLVIVGDGPLREKVQLVAKSQHGIEWVGHKSHDEVLSLMKKASFLIFPSECYEGFPMVIAEAYSTGLPVVASNLGAASSIVDHERTGVLFQSGDPVDLAEKIEWINEHPKRLASMQKEARLEYEAKYTMKINYQILIDIYKKAAENAQKA